MAHKILHFGEKQSDLFCNHSNGYLFKCEDNMLLSRVKISCLYIIRNNHIYACKLRNTDILQESRDILSCILSIKDKRQINDLALKPFQRRT